MSGEAEIELEVDANVEIEIDVQPEVELEVVVDLEAPKVEIELEIEVPQVEIEINCPDLNVESNLEGKLNAEVEVGGSTQIVYQGGNSNHMPYLVCRWMFCMIIFGIMAVAEFAYFGFETYRLAIGKYVE